MNEAQESAQKVINAAEKHVNNGAAMQSSAELCLFDANTLIQQGNYAAAEKRALRSLAYSVGIFHSDYKRFSKAD